MSPGKILKCLAAASIGAVALTVLHQVLRRAAPPSGLPPRTPEGPALYGLVRSATVGKSVATGAALGLAAGIGSVFATGPASAGAGSTYRNWSAQAMNAGLYAAGGLAAGLAYRHMNTK